MFWFLVRQFSRGNRLSVRGESHGYMGFIHWLACCYWIHLVTAQAAMPTTFNHPKPPTTTPKHPQPPGHVASAITNKCNYGFTRRMRHIYMFFTLPLAVALHFNWVACAAGSANKKKETLVVSVSVSVSESESSKPEPTENVDKCWVAWRRKLMRFGCKRHQTLEIFCVNLKNDMKAAWNNRPNDGWMGLVVYFFRVDGWQNGMQK